MSMRSTWWAVGAVAVGSLLGCGQQPRYYRVAIDETPLHNLPASCYESGTAPTDQTTNVVDVEQWILWDGVEGRKYLQVGNIDYALGDADDVDINGDALVSTGEGGETTFTARRTRTNPDRVYEATYTLDQEGETLEGTIALSSTCTGTACAVASCTATLSFVGRRIDADQEVLLGNSASD
jgi:hypothetical protein